MLKTNPSVGKNETGGSIILTASGELQIDLLGEYVTLKNQLLKLPESGPELVLLIVSGDAVVSKNSTHFYTSILCRLCQQISVSNSYGSRIHGILLTMLYSVNSMAQTAAYQLARTNIRVNSICPGLIETGMTTLTFDYARQRGTASKIGQLNPLGRYAIAEGKSLLTLSVMGTCAEELV